MVGHDPQQTGRSLSTVRLHPRLLFTYTDDACGTPLVDGAYAPSGRLLWHCTTGDDVISLAARADGTVVALGRTGISAVSPAGHRLWRRPLGRQLRTPSAQPPTIAVDAMGRAYLGSSDGIVRVIAPNGSLLWTLPAGGPTSLGNTPSIALGPQGTLVVTGTDGRLRVYQ